VARKPVSRQAAKPAREQAVFPLLSLRLCASVAKQSEQAFPSAPISADQRLKNHFCLLCVLHVFVVIRSLFSPFFGD
jgi:hypothetical protein